MAPSRGGGCQHDSKRQIMLSFVYLQISSHRPGKSTKEESEAHDPSHAVCICSNHSLEELPDSQKMRCLQVVLHCEELLGCLPTRLLLGPVLMSRFKMCVFDTR